MIVPVIAERIPGLKSLSPEEKLILVGELWDELAAQPNALGPRDDHIALLKERLNHYRQHPSDVIAWEERHGGSPVRNPLALSQGDSGGI